jgi:hypothetical protein
MKRANLALFDFVCRVMQLLQEIFYDIEVAMLNSRKIRGVSFFILDGMVNSNRFYQMFYDIEVSSGHSEMQCHFSFSFL